MNLDFDRRLKPRLCEPIPIEVFFKGTGNNNYEFETVAKNISAGGLYAPAPRPMAIGSELEFRIRFARAGTNPPHAPEASAQGKVVRIEENQDGTCYFAASFTRHRML